MNYRILELTKTAFYCPRRGYLSRSRRKYSVNFPFFYVFHRAYGVFAKLRDYRRPCFHINYAGFIVTVSHVRDYETRFVSCRFLFCLPARVQREQRLWLCIYECNNSRCPTYWQLHWIRVDMDRNSIRYPDNSFWFKPCAVFGFIFEGNQHAKCYQYLNTPPLIYIINSYVVYTFLVISI